MLNNQTHLKSQEAEYIYTFFMLIGHLVALEDHLKEYNCNKCIIKHVAAIKVYFSEMLNYLETEAERLFWNKRLNDFEQSLEQLTSDKIRDIRLWIQELVRQKDLLKIKRGD